MTEYAMDMAADTVRLERDLPGPIERVWAYLTESDKRAKWLARGPMDLREGGTVELTWENGLLSKNDEPAPESYQKVHSIEGRISACEPPNLLSFTWGGEPDSSEAVFELTEIGDRVRLVVTHRRLADRAGKIGVSGGWHSHLGLLEDILNGEEPRPFWKNFNRLRAEYEKRL
jgi:uncharacterized protein YndB with AHSA1/START domain